MEAGAINAGGNPTGEIFIHFTKILNTHIIHDRV